jgi:hypothetical protein
MELTIDPEFESLCPPLAEDELRYLRTDITRVGCLQNLIAWDGILIDGHNRYRICTEENVPFKVRELAFMDRRHARDWIITNQLGRRNLTAEQKKYLIGLRFNAEKGSRGKNHQNDVSTADKLAEEYKIGKATVERSGQFANAVDSIAANVGPEARTAILQRDSGLTAKNVIELARRPVEEQRSVIERKSEVKMADEPLNDFEVEEKQLAALMAAWNKAGMGAREKFLARIDQPVFDKTRNAR